MKKFLTWFSLGVFLVAGVYACITMAGMPRTYTGYDSPYSVYEMMNDPSVYGSGAVDGAAAGIVRENLAKTQAVNNVTSIVFDFRGYDTMGEAFILVVAVTGSTVILFSRKKEEKKEDGKDE